MHHGLLTDLGIAIVIAAAMTVIMHFLRQPLILGYLVAGLLIGPHMTPQLVTDVQNIDTISEIGLVLLLFIIGLELSPHNLITHGRAMLISGGLQFPLNMALATVLLMAAGHLVFWQLNRLELLYIAVFCSLSSTAIVVKSLYDKVELESIAGRLSVGVLIFQDLWAVFFLVLQPNLNNPQLGLIFLSLLKAVLLLGAGFFFSKYILSALFLRIARNPELVVSLAIGWCALLASVASVLGLSLEMGALIAGFAISIFPYHVHITARVAPLRDFFMTLFFISLGMKIPSPEARFLLPVTALLAAVVFSKLVVVIPLTRLAGGSARAGILTALNLGQVSEFSLVIASVALKYGHISGELMSILVYALGISAVTSTYTIKYNVHIYRFWRRLFGWLFSSTRKEEAEFDLAHDVLVPPIFILGFHRGARAVVESLKSAAPEILHQIRAIDYNLEVLGELSQLGIQGMFGDISSVETLRHCGIERAKLILSTVPDLLLKDTSNLKLVRACRQLNPKAVIIATAETPDQVRRLEDAGAHHVVLPYSLVGQVLAEQILAISAGEFEEKP
ncbi:MAG: cation:proton antiporter [Turneriella sp.]